MHSSSSLRQREWRNFATTPFAVREAFPNTPAAFPGRDPPHSFGNKVDGKVRRSPITKDRVHHLPSSFVLALPASIQSSSAISTTLTLAYGLPGGG